ncbi:MAG TPA: hypothetical protein VK142_00155 [Bacillota bacterium]|nr:hypothetical protein [Bacillota bacterium]
MSYRNVLNQIKKNQIAPVYLLYGTESYFIQDLQKQIIMNVIPNQEKEHIIHYDLEEVPIQEVIADAETYPFFSERKLIIAHNAVFLKTKPPKLMFETMWMYYSNTLKTRCLILFLCLLHHMKK